MNRLDTPAIKKRMELVDSKSFACIFNIFLVDQMSYSNEVIWILDSLSTIWHNAIVVKPNRLVDWSL